MNADPTGLKQRVQDLSVLAKQLVDAGYGPIPISTGAKAPEPGGFQGFKNPMPTYAKWLSAVQATGDRFLSIGVRLPHNVVAIDLDLYKSSTDPATREQMLVELRVAEWPKTLRITARGFDDLSGHYLFRLPDDADEAQLVGKVRGLGETLRYTNRYTMGPGQWNPDAQRSYVWLDERTGELGVVPAAQLPLIPEFLLEMLTKRTGNLALVTPPRVSRAERVDGEWCWMVADTVGRTIEWPETGRHDQMNAGIWSLLNLEAEGHIGVEAAVDTLRQAFIDELEARPRSDTSEPPGREFDRSLRDGRSKVKAPEADPDSCPCVLTAWDPQFNAEEQFWASRPWLSQVLRVSAGMMQQPWMVLGALMTRLAGEIPPWVVLPPIAGPRVGLNLYVSLVGDPSVGKSAAIGIAAEAWRICSHLDGKWTAQEGGSPGSGEGLASAFGSTNRKGEWEWRTHRAIFSADEIETLEAASSRVGSSLSGVINSIWMGHGFGFAYKGVNKVVLDGHRYRASIVVGVQPGKAGWLLKAADSGAPQRYLWMPKTMRADMNQPQFDWQPAIVLPRSFYNEFGTGEDETHELVDVQFDPKIAHMIRLRRQDQINNENDLPQHSDLQRMKLAAIFAATDGRMNVTEQDWWLADRMVIRSERTKQWLIEQERDLARQARIHQGEAHSEVQDAETDAMIRTRAKWMAKRIQAHNDHECTNRCLKNSVTRPVKGMSLAETRTAVRSRALELGWIEQFEYTAETATGLIQTTGYRVGTAWSE